MQRGKRREVGWKWASDCLADTAQNSFTVSSTRSQQVEILILEHIVSENHRGVSFNFLEDSEWLVCFEAGTLCFIFFFVRLPRVGKSHVVVMTLANATNILVFLLL